MVETNSTTGNELKKSFLDSCLSNCDIVSSYNAAIAKLTIACESLQPLEVSDDEKKMGILHILLGVRENFSNMKKFVTDANEYAEAIWDHEDTNSKTVEIAM